MTKNEIDSLLGIAAILWLCGVLLIAGTIHDVGKVIKELVEVLKKPK